MNIELKKVKTFRGHEGHGLNAEIWVDGVRTAFVLDDASGSIFYDFTVYDNAGWNKLKAEVASRQPRPLIIDDKPFEKDGAVVMMEPSMEELIDEAFEKWAKDNDAKKLQSRMEREKKGLAKKFDTQIIYGPEQFDGSYRYFKFKRPLAEYPTPQLQKFIDDKKKDLQPGEVFYNTNFESLKIKV